MKIILTSGWQAFNMGFERRRDWNLEAFTGLPGLDPDFVSSQVDIVPVQSSQIGQFRLFEAFLYDQAQGLDMELIISRSII